MALWIRVVDGSVTITKVTPLNGKAFTLPELQRMVGGYIEALPLHDTASPHHQIMWLNEDGKAMHLPYNRVADLMAVQYSHLRRPDYVVGNVVVASKDESGEGPDDEE